MLHPKPPADEPESDSFSPELLAELESIQAENETEYVRTNQTTTERKEKKEARTLAREAKDATLLPIGQASADLNREAFEGLGFINWDLAPAPTRNKRRRSATAYRNKRLLKMKLLTPDNYPLTPEELDIATKLYRDMPEDTKRIILTAINDYFVADSLEKKDYKIMRIKGMFEVMYPTLHSHLPLHKAIVAVNIVPLELVRIPESIGAIVRELTTEEMLASIDALKKSIREGALVGAEPEAGEIEEVEGSQVQT